MAWRALILRIRNWESRQSTQNEILDRISFFRALKLDIGALNSTEKLELAQNPLKMDPKSENISQRAILIELQKFLRSKFLEFAPLLITAIKNRGHRAIS